MGLKISTKLSWQKMQSSMIKTDTKLQFQLVSAQTEQDMTPNDTVPDRCFPTCEPLPNHVLLIAINERERERLASRWNRKKWKKSWTERAAGDDHAGVSDVCRDTDASEGEHLLFVGFGIYGVSDVCSRLPSGLRPPAFCTSKLNCKGMA